jgi:hypothetical protein
MDFLARTDSHGNCSSQPYLATTHHSYSICPNMSSSANDSHALAVEELLRTLSTQPSVTHLAAIAHENARLRKENGELRNEYTANVTMIRRLGDDLDSTKSQFQGKHNQLQGVVKDKEALATELRATQKNLEESGEKAASLSSKFKKQQEEVEKKLDENTRELQRLGKLFVALQSVDDQEEEMWV